jgi:hypothetical protein
VFRTERRRSPKTGQAYPWIVGCSAMVNKLLHLCGRPGLRAVLPQVLQLLSLRCQTVPERPRICQTPARTRRHLLRGRDFGVGRRLHNLPRLREIGFAANCRRLPSYQNGPLAAGRQHTSGPRFADPRVHLLSHALVLFRQLAQAFRIAQFFTPTYNRLLRPGLANALSMRRLLTREAQFAG